MKKGGTSINQKSKKCAVTISPRFLRCSCSRCTTSTHFPAAATITTTTTTKVIVITVIISVTIIVVIVIIHRNNILSKYMYHSPSIVMSCIYPHRTSKTAHCFVQLFCRDIFMPQECICIYKCRIHLQQHAAEMVTVAHIIFLYTVQTSSTNLRYLNFYIRPEKLNKY